MYRIVYYGDKRLQAENTAVEKIDGKIKSIVKKMTKCMFSTNGIGLAAPQVGINSRIVVIDTSFGESRDKVVALFNPEIIEYSPETIVMEEGCLSFPGLYIEVERSAKVKVKAMTLDGREIEFEGTDYFARVLQHEIDHINGTVMVDRMDPLKRMEISKQLAEIRAKAEIV